MSEIRVRLAPSPTGKLHIGNARTGLFNYLFARHTQGKFILRVEDTDEQRSTHESEIAIYEGLKWLGMDWDEGPDKPGKFGPYRQSERVDIYKKFIDQMIDNGTAYYCFCPQEELGAKREAAEKAHVIYRYDNTCRNVPIDEAKRRVAAGERATIRLRVPDDVKINFTDLIREDVDVESETFDDFIIAKPGGMPLYNFACVIDDHLMEITHVLRGQDHLTNTSKQILIYKALGWEVPKFGHFSLIMNTQRKKLSKREGAVYIGDFQAMGYLPEAVVNFIALLGWNPGDNREKMTLQEMVDAFSLGKIQRSDAIFDPEKLKWLNGVYIREMPLSKLTEEVIPHLAAAGFDPNKRDRKWLESVIALEQERIRLFSEAPDAFDFFFKDELKYDKSLLDSKKKTPTEIANALEIVKDELSKIENWNHTEIENTCRALASSLNWGAGDLFMPIRIAVTGKKATPPLFESMEVLGRSLSLDRIDKAASLIKN